MKLFYLAIWIGLLASCSQQRLAIRFADSAVSWTADDYFDLTSSQKEDVKKEFKLLMKSIYENNKREIPLMFDRVDSVLANTSEQKKIDCSEIKKIKTQAGTVVPSLVKIGAIQVQKISEKLSEKQIQYFVREVGKKIEEEELQLKKSSEREEKRLENTLDNLLSFLGSLTEKQKAEVEKHIKANPFPFEEQLNTKKSNYEKLKVSSVRTEAFRSFVLDYIQDSRKYQSAIYLKKADELRLNNEVFYQNLICEATTQQLKFLRKKLSGIKADFEEFFI